MNERPRPPAPHEMQLRDLDLNLLVVFRHLVVHRRVSRAAEELGISQPAASNALARLRRALGDPLFVPTPAGMQPTPRAEQLAAAIGPALEGLEAGLNQQAAFDPASSQRRFTIAMTDIGEIYFLPRLTAVLAAAAPGVTLATARTAAANLREAMEAGQVDLAVGLLPQLKSGFHQRRLFSQPYVCLFRRDHPLTGRRLSMADYLEAEHVLVVSAGTGHGRVDAWLEARRIRRRVRLTVPHFVAVGHILRDSDLLATVPQRLAEALAGPFGLAWSPHPAPLPESTIHVFWHARVHRDPASRWLRSRLVETFGR